jgi:hypothetical protein
LDGVNHGLTIPVLYPGFNPFYAQGGWPGPTSYVVAWAADGSLFPTGSGFNPTLTIVALALRLADRLSRLR